MDKKLFLLLIPPLLYAQTSIKEAWEILLKENDTIKVSSTDVTIATKKKKSAKSMYLPSIDLSASYTHMDKPIDFEYDIQSALLGKYHIQMDLSKQDVFLANLHMLWPLYVGGKIDATQEIFQAKLNEAEALHSMKQDVVFLKLVKYYYGVVVAEALYKTRLQAEKSLKLHYENAKKLQQQGQIANVELLNAKVKYDIAQIETKKAWDKLGIAQSALNSLLHTPIQPQALKLLKTSPKSINYYQEQMQSNYAVFDLFRAKDQETKAFLEIKRSAWKPQVFGYANYNLYKDDSILSESLPNWFTGVVVKFDILKRRDRNEGIAIAKLTAQKVDHMRAEAKENLSLLVEQTYKELQSALKEYQALASSIELAKENYRLRELAFEEGLGTSVDVADAQAVLLGAQTKRLNAGYTFIQKLAQLCVLAGDRDAFFTLEKDR